MSDVYALVRSIRERRWSRNRHFADHATPSGAAARRLHRFLAAVERDVIAAEEVTVQPTSNGGCTVAMKFPAVRLTRAVALSAEEHALLVEDERIAARLGRR